MTSKLYTTQNFTDAIETHKRRQEMKGKPNARMTFFYLDNKKFTYNLTLKTFYNHGFKCCKCGIIGTHFKLEKDDSLHLYGVKKGKQFLITKDHITPVSKGGTNHIENLQTMCFPCNNLKANNEWLNNVPYFLFKLYEKYVKTRVIYNKNKRNLKTSWKYKIKPILTLILL